MTTSLARAGALAAAAWLLAGCASLPDDGGLPAVAELTRARVGHAPGAAHPAHDERRQALLAAPLSPDGAIELALAHNAGLQAQLAELRVAQADLAQAGRLPNPAFRFGRLRRADGTVDIEREVGIDVLGLLTLPLAVAAERQRLEAVQLAAADAAVALASDVRRAWVRAVAARELAALHARADEAAAAASAYAERLRVAGNLSALARLREQAFAAGTTARLARARLDVVTERERLVRLLGLADGTGLTLPDRLPDLPAAPRETADAEQAAMDGRLDVQRARRDAEAVARSLRLVQASRFVNVLTLGYQNESTSGEPRANGVAVELVLPVFDGGGPRRARAEALYDAARHRTADVALRARSEVREAHAAYRTAWALARHHRDEVVPLHRRIAEESLLRHNGMLNSVFDLLADARAQVDAATGHVEALRDFWLADDALRTATTGRSPAP